MKKTLIFIFLISNIIFSQSSDLNQENLKGKIKTLQELYFEVEHIYKEVQDEEGYPDIKIVDYKKGKAKGTDEYIGYKNFYNRKGFKTENYQYYYGELSGKTKYILNEDNQKVETIDYRFVNNEFLERKKHYSNEYIYKKNQIIEKSTFIETGKPYSISIYNYNTFGKLVSFKTEYFNTGQKINQGYIYDSNNFLIDIVVLPNKKTNSEPTFINDINGNPSIEKSYKYFKKELRKIIKKHKYKYDEKGNWTEKVTYINDMAEIITERNIEYY